MNDSNKVRNIVYVDGQNLYRGTSKLYDTSEQNWKVDLHKLRVYLRDKYEVDRAYYYLGFVQDGDDIQRLYEDIQSAGFILVFRQHNAAMIGKKKGNVDADIIFSVMKRLYEHEQFAKVVLVSGDGDYKMLVDFLIEQNKFAKILFPNKKFASSLYKSIGGQYFDYLNAPAVKAKIAWKPKANKKEKGPLGN